MDHDMISNNDIQQTLGHHDLHARRPLDCHWTCNHHTPTQNSHRSSPGHMAQALPLEASVYYTSCHADMMDTAKHITIHQLWLLGEGVYALRKLNDIFQNQQSDTSAH